MPDERAAKSIELWTQSDFAAQQLACFTDTARPRFNRMPLILEPDTWHLWLKDEPDTAAALMKPAKEDLLTERTVSKAVRNVKNNGSELLNVITAIQEIASAD